jgi:hypothetical protein
MMPSYGSPVSLQKFWITHRLRLLSILWVQKKEAQICMYEWSQSFTPTQNMGGGFFLCSIPPTNRLFVSPNK